MRALLFDLDGTLVDTGRLHYAATIKALSELGIAIDRAAYDRHIHGSSNAAIARYLFPDDRADIRATYIELKETAFRASLGQAAPLPGLLELLDWARDQPLAVGLVTNAPVENKDLLLASIGLTGRFHPVVLGDTLAQAKPHPLPYLTALDQLGVGAGEAVGFDDSVHGITAVRDAGMYGIGVTTGQPAIELKAAGAGLCIADFRDPQLMTELTARL
ncbi:MAG: HAD-IA family hydrolase [Rhodospirillales bacterium]|nr:HAD-IA family hydrolase [Rhodospirillales bacterium]